MSEEDYVKNNETLLKLLNKEEALSAFIQQQPEKQKIDILKQEIEQLQTRLKSNDEQKNKKQGSINYLSNEHKKVENKQKQELQKVKQFCEKRDKMLASLPPSMRDKATKQFQKLAQSQDEFNPKDTKPEEIFPSAGFVAKLIHGKKLKEFDAYFADIAKKVENGDIVTNFDMSVSFEEIAKGMNQKYDAQKEDLQSKIKERQSELNTIDNSIDNDKKTLQTKENDLTQSENSLNEKVNKFSAVYDTHPFVDTSYIDPVVQKALDNGQIHGEDREKQVLASLLSKACQNSEIAKDVLYESLNKGTKYFIAEQFSRVSGNYSLGVISVDVNTLNHLTPGNQEVKAMGTLIHESRHACQDTGKNIVLDNWANTFIQSSIQEVDAYSMEVAAVYQLNHQLGTTAYQDDIRDNHKYMLEAFSREYEQSKDTGKALNAASLEWDKWYGYAYKTQRYINQDWCHLQENAETIHPEEIAKRNNIMYQGKPYMDMEKVTQQILTIDKSDYDVISQKLELSGQKDDSLQYFSVKTPEFNRDVKDELGLDALEYKITLPTKKFTFSPKNAQSEANDERIPFGDMSPQKQGKFIQKELRQGKNSFLSSETNTTAMIKGKTLEKGKISGPLKFNRGKGMEM